MNDYTPTTDEVRDQFAAYEDPRMKRIYDYPAEAETFNRWLAAHDEATQAQAWDEGAQHAGGNRCLFARDTDPCPQNPYRATAPAPEIFPGTLAALDALTIRKETP